MAPPRSSQLTPFLWSLREIAVRTADGELSPDQVVGAAAASIAASEDRIHAWCRLTDDAAREAARALAGELDGPGPRSALHGVPFGAKDIFDTAGVPTEWGSATQSGRTPGRDCGLIARLKALGCVLMGKTHTTAYAYYDTGPTRNPANLAHTPGGSSSGSAAAVAAGMVPFAIGSQTQGSVLRPASFCGVVGFKPSFGVLPLDGVMPFAPTLDHAGLFTQSVADMHLVWKALGHPLEAPVSNVLTVVEWPPSGQVTAAMEAALEATLLALKDAGMRIQRVDRPRWFNDLPAALHTVMAFEAAREHGEAYRRHGKRVGAKLATLIEQGMASERRDYSRARGTLAGARQTFAEWSGQHGVVATPAALGAAPSGLESSGDPRCNAPFTCLGAPSISLPMPTDGLPMGLQLAAPFASDALVLATAEACERALTH